jgi:uncharacterized surface protein with fasciclin (FAS1) repeats
MMLGFRNLKSLVLAALLSYTHAFGTVQPTSNLLGVAQQAGFTTFVQAVQAAGVASVTCEGACQKQSSPLLAPEALALPWPCQEQASPFLAPKALAPPDRVRTAASSHIPTLPRKKTSGPSAVFVPTDAAFGNLPEGQLPALLEDTDALTRLLQHHVVCGSALTSALLSSSWHDTLGGFSLRVENEPHGDHAHIYVSNGELDEVYDLAAGNGVVMHYVDKVLLPPTLANAVGFDRSLSTLQGALPTNVASMLSGGNGMSWTLFAPNDDAFAALSAEESDRLLGTNIDTTLSYHLLKFKIAHDCLPDGPVTTFGGLDLLIEDHDDHKHVGRAGFRGQDIMATNGVMHIISQVLLPPNLMEMLAQVPETPYYQMYGALSFSRLVEYIRPAGLEDELSTGDYTLFAPSDEAFARLEVVPSGAALVDLLLYHVVPNKIINSVALQHGPITMANGNTTFFDTSSDDYSHHHTPFPHTHGTLIKNQQREPVLVGYPSGQWAHSSGY